MKQLPYLVCQHCGKPIPLPPATRPDISLGQGSWPKDGRPRNFACHQCTQVYEYRAGQVQPPSEAGTDTSKQREPQNVVCISMPCDAGNCASQLTIRILVGIDRDPSQDAEVVGALAPAHSIRCDIGHMQRDGMRRASGISARFDPDWVKQEPEGDV